MIKPPSIPQFCPGPWRVEADPELKGLHPLHDSRYIVRGGEDDGSYTRICKMTDLQHQAGTAALIAAAPQMHAALVKISKICRSHVVTALPHPSITDRVRVNKVRPRVNVRKLCGELAEMAALACVGVPADDELAADATLLINILSDEGDSHE